MKIDRDRLNMLKEIMAIDFSLIELNLYLDTHPMDQRALAIYNDYTMNSKALREEYEKKYAFLTPMNVSGTPWQWIEGPWPWQINYEMGGK